ncbi:MAG: crossover junction endodeoxyribonuclease RuvC [Bacteroidetes bacterium]|mgnify:CR=1 FL=1|nr:MAG: crossover junction endodeoxyribonuclease RuvC [Bacteroidota bacterium]REK06050.1 MAG: crossover junction endodeoxyribonuclease RuvC [Bacteroidota bacterium]REK37108.1 MAG: crossover junction endodeoxyribonuclease RuvC [Bacteroidota bacterium]REK47539.1 MAG: crossover junction endodeoxyribonuclease RuvC [Bacteroidota bacterium]
MQSAKNLSDKIILGIDPGTNVMGYGLISVAGTNISLLHMGVLQLIRTDDHPLKLKKIFEHTLELIDKYNPDDISIEAPFYGKNVQSMLKLGRAQGVAMAAGLHRLIPIFEYSPKKIKQSITGNGNASKEQVAAMLMTLLHFKESPEFLDATDGLAAAVCHNFQKGKSNFSKTGGNSWKAFINANPGRLRAG